MPNLSPPLQHAGPTEAEGAISTADVEGVAVYDCQGNRLGKIDHLLIDKVSGQVRSFVLVTKGFLGLGHGHCELAWQSLRYSRLLHAYVTGVSNQR